MTALDDLRAVRRPVDTAGRGTVDGEQVMLGMGIIAVMGAVLAGFLAADAPIMAVAAASALFLAVAIILRPDVATLTTIAILYSNAAVIAVHFHGVPLFAAATFPLAPLKCTRGKPPWARSCSARARPTNSAVTSPLPK